MTLTPDEFVATQKANAETFFALSNKALESVEKLMELNMQFAKSTLAEVSENTQTLLSIKDPHEFLAFQTKVMQPSTEKVAAYSRQVHELFSGASAELTQLAAETLSEGQKRALALVDSASLNAPAGTENAVALVKSAMSAASNAFEGVQKAARQASDVAEANLQAMTATAVKATQPPPKAKLAA